MFCFCCCCCCRCYFPARGHLVNYITVLKWVIGHLASVFIVCLNEPYICMFLHPNFIMKCCLRQHLQCCKSTWDNPQYFMDSFAFESIPLDRAIHLLLNGKGQGAKIFSLIQEMMPLYPAKTWYKLASLFFLLSLLSQICRAWYTGRKEFLLRTLKPEVVTPKSSLDHSGLYTWEHVVVVNWPLRLGWFTATKDQHPLTPRYCWIKK